MALKFIDFTRFLENCKESYLELTFEQIENIIGQKLSSSTYQYNAYWYLSPTHTFPQAWLAADYKLDKLDLKGQKVYLIKDRTVINSNANQKTVNPSFPITDSKKEKTLIDIDLIVKKAKDALIIINSDENSRYLSWEHCYKSFATCKEINEENLDFLALHLAFYLASWGMYRGSSFLLQKDYKVHKDAIKEIFDIKYKSLWGISCVDIISGDNLTLLFELSYKLKEIYIRKRKNLDEYEDTSNTLITKILMGTLGCVPAYDRYFVSTIKKFKMASGNYNKQSIYDLASFYNDNREKLQLFRGELSSNRKTDYPEMKVLDMSFWYMAFEEYSNTTRKVKL